MRDVQAVITSGEASIGIEFGSTRIKAVLINVQGDILATGGFTWENHFVDGIWTYPQDEIWQGLQAAYRALTDNVKEKYGLSVTKAKAIGISGMMHGYMPFDQRGGLLVPFRTWRNNITAKSSQKLTALLTIIFLNAGVFPIYIKQYLIGNNTSARLISLRRWPVMYIGG